MRFYYSTGKELNACHCQLNSHRVSHHAQYTFTHLLYNRSRVTFIALGSSAVPLNLQSPSSPSLSFSKSEAHGTDVVP